MGYLPYEAAFIIPLQTLLMDCKCLLTTQTQVLQLWDKNLHIKCSEHQLRLLKYIISQYHHSETIAHDITLKTNTRKYWTKKKKKNLKFLYNLKPKKKK